MKTRELFQKIMSFEPVDRIPVIEWASWWSETLARWEKEGLEHPENPVELMRDFGLDRMVQEWISIRAPHCPEAAGHGTGIIANADDYDRLIADKMLFPEELPILKQFARYEEEHKNGEAAFWFSLEGFFWFPRTLFGIEQHLYAFYDQSELMLRINRDLCDHYKRILSSIVDRFQPEFMTFAEDMSYNHGPMISEELFDQFMLPFYQELIPLLKAKGVRVFIDSDGDISDCIHWFKRAGIEGLLPLERQAGVDVVKLRKEHPDFLFLGAFDKTVMHRGEAALRHEFERLLPVICSRGFLPGVDHQTPPSVSLADYQLYLKLAREYYCRGNIPAR